MSDKWGSRKRRPVPDLRGDREAILAKVRAKCILDPFTGCWTWQGFRNSVGYGTTNWKGRPWMLSRLVLAATVGPFNPDLDACHSCHNRACANPEHLRPDEHQENLLDSSKDRRLQGQWKTHCKRGHPLVSENLSPTRKWRYCLLCEKIRRASPEYKAKIADRNRRYRLEKRLSRGSPDLRQNEPHDPTGQ